MSSILRLLAVFLLVSFSLAEDISLSDSAASGSQVDSSLASANDTASLPDTLSSFIAADASPPEPVGPESPAKPSAMAVFNNSIASFLFFDISFGVFKSSKVDREGNPVLSDDGAQVVQTQKIPIIIFVLLFGGVFFTFRFGWVNIKGFKHSLKVIMGKYDKPEHKGEITHFRALTSALSATVGLGNIAGVAIAIQMGGPGAVFWMTIAAIFGMSSKFASCTLSQLYRKVNINGSISGGPMYYLDLGLKEKGPLWSVFGKLLAFIYAIFVIGGAIGGGNMFQINQTVEAYVTTFNLPTGNSIDMVIGQVDATAFGIGIIVAIFVGVVILGGIKRIGAATSKVVPIMVGMYILSSLFIIFKNYEKIPEVISLIVKMAFTGNAFYGGMIGVFVWGIKRASFSNEAGLGSAAIAHAAAKTDEPVREGIVAMLGPFIDTIVVCNMTAFVVIISGAWNEPSIPHEAGVALTTYAYGTAISWFPYVLTGCIGLFAYSTMISWCYYGERAWIYLLDHVKDGFGLKTMLIYRLMFLFFIIVGAVNTLSDVLLFTDLLILSMAFPNIIGVIILSGKIKRLKDDYVRRLKSGEIHAY